MNPTAGSGLASQAEPLLAEFCGRHGGELLSTLRPGHAVELARRAADAGVERILVGGGDDTFREVLQGVLHHAVPPELGLVPLGTYNNFARALGLPPDPRAGLETAFRGHLVPVDLGLVNEERIFTESVGAGFEAEAWSHWPEIEPVGLGRLWRGASIVLQTLRTFQPQLYHLLVDGTEEMVRAMNITVANTPEFAAQVTSAPKASLTDGRLDVCVIGELTLLRILAFVPAVVAGLHPYLMSSVEYKRARAITISGTGPVRVDSSIDLRLPVRIRILPGRIRVRVPQVQWP